MGPRNVQKKPAGCPVRGGKQRLAKKKISKRKTSGGDGGGDDEVRTLRKLHGCTPARRNGFILGGEGAPVVASSSLQKKKKNRSNRKKLYSGRLLNKYQGENPGGLPGPRASPLKFQRVCRLSKMFHNRSSICRRGPLK